MIGLRQWLPSSYFEGNVCVAAALVGGDSSVSCSGSSIHRKENDRGNRALETKHKECVPLQGMWMHLEVLMWSVLCLKLALGLS